MKQIFQNLSDGKTIIEDIPCPKPKDGEVLISTSHSLISSGTERMLVDFGKASYFKKAMSQPDKVKMVLQKAKADGIIATYDSVKSKLDQPMPLGYCNVGVVMDSGNTKFDLNTRVVSNGNHAEVVRVPKNLVAAIPENVDNESASFTVLAAIAMQGIRLIKPTIGESIVVTGLGLIGLLAVQILRASGCKVLAIDIDSKKCELARDFGAETVDLSKGEDVEKIAKGFSCGRGVDAVLITASSPSDKIMQQSANISRKRGRIVLVGVVGLNLRRSDFYDKELTFQVSCSYGPGRYDSSYEEQGFDYPLPYVRWTEQRNFEAVLDLMSSGNINVKPLITNKYHIDDAELAYSKLDDSNSIAILLNYNDSSASKKNVSNSIVLNTPYTTKENKTSLSFIGGGNYASRILIPAFKKAGADLHALVTSKGYSAVHHGKSNKFSIASTDISDALSDETDLVIIATQHNLHAIQALSALEAEKHVFVEKPLALTHNDIDILETAYKKGNNMIMVGFNRRFSPLVVKMKELLKNKVGPKTFIYTVNSGYIPKDNWIQDFKIGGGRIIGEACHFIDMMRFLIGCKITSFTAERMGNNQYIDHTEDKAIITLCFEDGSIGSIQYFSNGGKSFQKERIEIFCDDSVLQLNNFRNLVGYGWNKFKKISLWSQDKGQLACAKAVLNSIQNSGIPPIPPNEIFEVARISIDIAESLRK